MRATPADAARIALPALAVVVFGVIVLGLALPADGPPVTEAARSVHRWWYMGRASGFVAYALMLASMLLGIGISSRVFDGVLVRPWVFDMHQFTSIFALVAMAFHVLVLLPDPYTHFSLAELLVPFASPYRPIAVALGVISLYGSVAVTLSYYVKRWIGQGRWRTLHYASFALFAAALVHGATAGADAGETWVQLLYLLSGLAVVFFTFFRILAARSQSRPRPSAPTPRAALPGAAGPVSARAGSGRGAAR